MPSSGVRLTNRDNFSNVFVGPNVTFVKLTPQYESMEDPFVSVELIKVAFSENKNKSFGELSLNSQLESTISFAYHEIAPPECPALLFLNLELDYNKILEINSGQHEAISSRTKHLSKVKASLQGGFLGSLPLEYF